MDSYSVIVKGEQISVLDCVKCRVTNSLQLNNTFQVPCDVTSVGTIFCLQRENMSHTVYKYLLIRCQV